MVKRLVEDCLTLDLAWLMRLAPNCDGHTGSGNITWRTDDAAFRAARVRLNLRNAEKASLTIASDAVNQTISLVAVPQNFGGQRWWFLCPMTGKRARNLHLPPGADRFASREAWGLAYRSERANRFDRPFEKLFRAQRRLGNLEGLGAGFDRPKGMWAQTYFRHARRFVALDIACVEKIVALVENA